MLPDPGAPDPRSPAPERAPDDPARATPPTQDPAARRDSWRRGLRAGAPYATAGLLLSASFGIVATDAGFSSLQAVVMSVVVFAGSAQFAAIGILGAGGALGAAVAAAALANSRFLPMGVALAPSLPGGPLRRMLEGQTVVDSSWVMGQDEHGRFDRWFLFGSTAVQYTTWAIGTTLGAYGGDVLEDPDALGLDAIFPAFFLSLLLSELKGNRRALVVAGAGALITLALIPVAPVGVPILAASLAAFAGLKVRDRDPSAA